MKTKCSFIHCIYLFPNKFTKLFSSTISSHTTLFLLRRDGCSAAAACYQRFTLSEIYHSYDRLAAIRASIRPSGWPDTLAALLAEVCVVAGQEGYRRWSLITQCTDIFIIVGIAFLFLTRGGGLFFCFAGFIFCCLGCFIGGG